MAHIIWTDGKGKDKLDPSLHKKAFAFTQKLREDDSQKGLNVEEIKGSRDKRVRTGRVDDNFRAVLFKIAGGEHATYVFYGIWPHDKANSIAERVTLEMNPINGVPEIREIAPTATNADVSVPAPGPDELPVVQDVHTPIQQAAWVFRQDPQRLHEDLGLDLDLAVRAVSAPDEPTFITIAQQAPVEWQGLALLALATGSSVDDVRTEFHLFEDIDTTGTEDEQLVQGLRREAARSAFHWIDSDEELRRVIEAGDFGAWRAFLHPEQRNYVTRDYNGPFRLTGGAGTGKTVVAVHRAVRLATQDPQARVLLTTYTRNLADDLLAQVRRLDPSAPIADQPAAPGISVRGVDQVARAVLQQGGRDVQAAAADVIGTTGGSFLKTTPDKAWDIALEDAGVDLPDGLASATFLSAEYSLVVLPHRIRSEAEYLRVRRAGRGVSLDRVRRRAVWAVVERYRENARMEGETDFDEKAAIAARVMETRPDGMFDHVLVDEAQDLTPSRLRLLRAIVRPGRNDLFICEDSHQRIYGHKVTLGSVGIKIVGRSRRLTLNYRTTDENLRWAMGILGGGEYTDMDGAPEKASFRSARSGPAPTMEPAASMADELDRAAELLNSWMPGEEEGRAPAQESIAVLVRDRYRRETVVNGLHERNLQARGVDNEGVRPGMPVVMTMHRAKGLEFTHVLLFGLKDWSGVADQPDEERDDAMLRERSLFYVAATRARDVLAVSWAGERPTIIPR